MQILSRPETGLGRGSGLTVIVTGIVVPVQPAVLTGVTKYVAVIGVPEVLLIMSLICNFPAGSAAILLPAVPCPELSDIVGAGQLKIVPAGIFAGDNNISLPIATPLHI